MFSTSPEPGDEKLRFGDAQGHRWGVTKESFVSMLHGKIRGSSWDRALDVYRNYGTNLTGDVTNALLHAADQRRVDEVLDILEQHFKEHLHYQHPEARGLLAGEFGINKTQVMFEKLCRETLHLQPVS